MLNNHETPDAKHVKIVDRIIVHVCKTHDEQEYELTNMFAILINHIQKENDV
jgi:hypothetical protein